MKRHISGAIIFSLIVGTIIFASYYFIVLPKQSEVFAPQISQTLPNENINSITPKIQIKSVYFYPEIQRFRAIFYCKNTNLNRTHSHGDWELESASPKCRGEDKVLHFFAVNKGQAQYLFTQDVVMGQVSTGGDAFTKPFELEPLLKMKPFRNVFVNAEYKSDYEAGAVATFDPEFSVALTSSPALY